MRLALYDVFGVAASAMKVLQAKLWRLELEKRNEEKKLSTIGMGSNSWGSQIRYYYCCCVSAYL